MEPQRGGGGGGFPQLTAPQPRLIVPKFDYNFPNSFREVGAVGGLRILPRSGGKEVAFPCPSFCAQTWHNLPFCCLRCRQRSGGGPIAAACQMSNFEGFR